MNAYFSNRMWKKSTLGLLGSAAALFVALAPSPLNGQSVNYGALQQLFNEPVTTSVTGSPQRVSDVPATIEIVTAEDIRRSGAKDIPGVLRHVGGIDTLEWGNDNIDVSIRGYDQAVSARLLVLVDGRQVYTDDYGYTPWSSIPVELGMIRQIEVIKGPNSALFGFNAAGGVINIITYHPLYDNINTSSWSAGTQEMATGSVVATHQFGSRAAVRLSVGGNTNNGFSTPIPPAVAVTSRERQYRGAININSIFRLNSRTLLGIEASHSSTKLNEMQAFYQLDNSRHNIDSLKGSLSVDSGIGLLQANVYTNWSRETVRPGYANQPFHFNNRVTVAEFHDIFKIGAHHTFRAAAEFRRVVADTTSVTGASVHENIVSPSAMWNWQITPTISLTNALRIDHLALGRDGFLPSGYPFSNSDWHHSFTQPSFNSGLVWKPSDVDSLRFIVGRGTQLPSLAVSGAVLVVTPVFNFSGSPSLKPTVVTNYEIGWDHIFPSPHILFRASVFVQDSENVWAILGRFIPTPGGPYLTPNNIGKSEAIGLELGLKGSLHNNYRWDVEYRREGISDDFTPSSRNGIGLTDFQHTTPGHLVKANLGWSSGRWDIDGYLHYQSDTFGLQLGGDVPAPPGTLAVGTLTPVAGFAALDGRVGYNLTDRLTWSVSGQNFTHASQVQTAGPAVERRALSTISFNF